MTFSDAGRLVAMANIPRKECWKWTGFCQPNGYAKIRVNGETRYAMRLMYELFIGPIPEGLHLGHLCRNRGCVNPYHLEPVTHRINVLRGQAVTAYNAKKTHCKRGHPFTPENTRPQKTASGRMGRVCITCARENAAAAYTKKVGRKIKYKPRKPQTFNEYMAIKTKQRWEQLCQIQPQQ